jgi:hypothetical protein
LYNGLARYEEAAVSARQAAANTFDPWLSIWALPELIEAAARAGDAELAHDAIERLARTTQPSGNDSALGIDARCRALLSDRAAADELYREAVERLSRTVSRPSRSGGRGRRHRRPRPSPPRPGSFGCGYCMGGALRCPGPRTTGRSGKGI